MNAELEALIKAYEALLETRDFGAKQPSQAFDALLKKTLNKHPGLSQDKLEWLVAHTHAKWVRKQESKPSHIPPKA